MAEIVLPHLQPYIPEFCDDFDKKTCYGLRIFPIAFKVVFDLY